MRIALAGVGLIGGSIGLAARERLGAHVVGYNRSPAALALALERGAIDEAATSIAAIGTADIAFAGVAVDALPDTVRALCDALPGAVVTDVGSTKAALVDAIDHPNFIGGHPLAGAEATPGAVVSFARSSKTVVALTGAVDRVSDGDTLCTIKNGHPLMTRVTAMGCAATALIAALAAVGGDALTAAASALLIVGIAGEIAGETAKGPGTFQPAFLDAVAAMTPDLIRSRARTA